MHTSTCIPEIIKHSIEHNTACAENSVAPVQLLRNTTGNAVFSGLIINISPTLQCHSSTTEDLPRSTLHRLSCENLHRTSCSGVNLIIHHVLEPLVVGWSKEHLRVQLTSSESIVQNLHTWGNRANSNIT